MSKQSSNQATAITTRQEIKQAGKRATMFVKGEKESLAKYNADGQQIVKQALADASLSQEQVYKFLSVAMVRGFNDFVGNFNPALLWFILQEAINSPFGLDLFGKLEKAFYCATGGGLRDTDDKGNNIFDKKESIISISKKQGDNGKYTVNISLKKGYTRNELGKAWNKIYKPLAGNENIIAHLLGKYIGKPAPQEKPKHEKSLADIMLEIIALHDSTSDTSEKEKCAALITTYKKA